jgi:hypothetical protein
MHTKFWVENLKRRDHVEDRGRDGKIVLKWIMRKQDVRLWTGFIWLVLGSSSGSFELGNEPLGSIKGEEFIDLLSDC